MIEVRFFKAQDGKEPFIDWYRKLRDRKSKTKIGERLDRIRFGNFGNHKALGAGVYELKITYGPGFRIYYGLESNIVTIILCGGDKSSQPKDIQKAKEYWALYKETQNGKPKNFR
jgi:putative addiction module killer protein